MKKTCNKRKRMTALLFLAVLCAGTGCSKKAPAPDVISDAAATASIDENTKGSSTPSMEPITLKVWGAIAEEQGPGELLDAFMELHPEIQAEYVYFKNDNSGNTKLNTALLEGSDVDVFFNYGAAKLIPRLDFTEDLTPYIEKEQFDMADNFGEGYLQADDKVPALPASSLKYLIYFNKDMLDAKGLTLPDDDWTYSEYMDYLEQLTSGEGADKIYGDVHSDGEVFGQIARGVLGGNAYYNEETGLSNFDNPIWLSDLKNVYEREVTLKVSENRIENLAAKVVYRAEFFTGRTASLNASDAMVRYAKDDENFPRDWVLAFANIPLFNEATVPNYAQGRSHFDFAAVSKNSKHKDAAWELAKFWATEGSVYMLKYGRIPAWTKTDTENALNLMFTPEQQALIDIASFKHVVLDFKTTSYNDTIFTAYSQITKLLVEEGEKVMLGSITPEQAVANLKQRADELIKNESE